jgi:pyruvate dehydrogenase E2 component (dihydrolipoamide acetyltransferase)
MQDVFVPAGGMAPDDVTLTAWLKEPGDPVSAGEPVALVETAKAELEIAATGDGVLGRRLFPQAARIAPGTTIARILSAGESEPADFPDPEDRAPVPAVPGGPPPASATGAEADGVSAPTRPAHRTSPRQRRLRAEAARSGQPAMSSEVSPAGRREPAAPDAPAARFREAISLAVTRSWHEIPHFAVARDLVVDEVTTALGRWRVVVPRLTLTDVLIRALALAFIERAGTSRLDVGLAVATERGVAIPVLRDVLSLGLPELAAARAEAIERARSGRLIADDSRVPVTTLSNLGAVGVDRFTGVVPYGQTNLLTVGRAAPRPVVADGSLAVATTMTVTLNVDHRTWDGHPAGQLLQRLAAVLAAPDLLFNPAAPAPVSEEN